MSSETQLRNRVLAIGLLAIAAIVGSAAYDGWRLHQQIMSADNRELGNLSRSLAADANRTLESVDSLLGFAGEWLDRNEATQSPEQLDSALRTMAERAPQVSALVVVDAAGHQRYRSIDTGEPLADVADRPYFQVQKERPDAGLFVNPPMLSRTKGVPAVVVSRRLNDGAGRFVGVVAATVTLAELRDTYKAIDLGDSSTLVLTLADGTLVIRQPEVDGPGGQAKLPELAEMRAGAHINRMISRVDGRPKLIAAVGVGRYPLILAVSRDEADALRPWVDEMWSSAIRTVLLTLVTLLIVVGVLRQIRRLEVATLALRQSEGRYAMAMDAANEGHAEWNVAEDAMFLSAPWRTMHGIGADEVVRTSDDLRRRLTLHPDDGPNVRSAIEDHLADRTPAIEMDYRVLGRDGEWHWIHARGRCLRNADRTPASLFWSSVDVSDRKRAEAEKAGFESRLEQTRRLEALGTLAGGIAHDFNNILGAILGFGEMAQRQAEPGSALRRHVDRVMQSGARARLLVRRILDFSRSGVGERTLVNVQGVVEEVLAMLTPTLPAGIEVQARLASGEAAVTGDATQLYQVVMNLATNAVQAVGDVGRLDVALDCRTLAEPASLLQGDLAPGDYVRLQVEDTGAGISPDVLARIFDPFFTTKPGGEGTGLGLSVVHGIVAGLGGAIDVAAREQGGTCVSVWLPVTGRLAPQPAESATEWPAGDGQVVMVVDDEVALVELAEELLASLGYEPVGYASAEAALAAFEARPERFDAVMTDLALPGMSGTELARRLLARRPALPVLLMSGNLGEAADRAAREAGVRATLHKPLALQELAEGLAALFRRAQDSR